MPERPGTTGTAGVAVELDDLTRNRGEWLRGSGPESDIVISSRIRLARNLADFPFISRANDQDRGRIEKMLHDDVLAVEQPNRLLYIDVERLAGIDRQFLVERHLISREHAEGHGARAVAIDQSETFSVMVNEEDHLRIQVMHSGLDLPEAWEQINRIDDLLEQKVTYAYHKRLGYLTACPTNVGTGMRVSVMLHLPARWSSPGKSRRSSAAFRRSAWQCEVSTEKALKPWVTSTRSRTRLRSAEANRTSSSRSGTSSR